MSGVGFSHGNVPVIVDGHATTMAPEFSVVRICAADDKNASDVSVPQRLHAHLDLICNI